jgi:hypothetical protein
VLNEEKRAKNEEENKYKKREEMRLTKARGCCAIEQQGVRS